MAYNETRNSERTPAMTLKEKIVFAAYLTTSVAIVAHAATEIYVTFKRNEPLRNQIKEAKKNA